VQHILSSDGAGARRVRWMAAALAFILSSCAARPPIVPSAPVTPEPVVRRTLANGLQVVIVRNSLAPVVTTAINYRVGSVETAEGFPGTAHAAEHMMFRGSPGLSADQLASITAAMGGRFNANTQETVTQYFFTVPADEFELPLRIEATRMRGVLATEALWQKERGAIEQEVAQDLSNPEFVAYEKILASVFRGTPYAHDPLGTRPSFERTTAAMLRRFHDTWYAPNNAILVIAGDVDPEPTLTMVERLFGGVPRKELPARPAFRFDVLAPGRFDLATDRPYGVVLLVFRLPGADSVDYPAARVLASVLANHRGPLYALAAAGKALDTDFSIEGLPAGSLGYAEVSFPGRGDGTALLTDVRHALAQTLKDGVPADLVEAAKRHEVTDAELQKESVEGLAIAWSRALAVDGRPSPEDLVQAVEAVTVADVERVANAFLDPERAVVAVLTPRASGEPTPARPLGGGESFAPEHVEHVPLPPWAEKALRSPSIPTSRVHPVETTLPNGLRLLVQPESVSRTVGVYGHVRNTPGLEAPPGQEGVDEVLERLFRYGTTALDRVSFQRALDEIGAQEWATTDFGVRVLHDDFRRAVALLADHVMHPRLSDEAFRTVRAQLVAELPGRLESPEYVAERSLEAALLPANDPALRQPTPSSVGSLGLDDVRAYHRRVFRPDLTTIVVIGRITADEARAAVERSFGSWTASGPKPETDLPPVPPNGPVQLVVPDAARVQDDVRLAETVGVTRSSPDYYALDLGNHVLAGAFYATRLYRDLRERRGLVYHVGSSLHMTKTRGMIELEYACDPQNVAQARAIIERDLGEMRSTSIRPAELLQARRLLLSSIPLSESSEGEIARGLLGRATEDLPLDEPLRAAERYLQLDADDVKVAFRHWVRPDGLAEAVLGPHP
jgi:zinc protease